MGSHEGCAAEGGASLVRPRRIEALEEEARRRQRLVDDWILFGPRLR